MALVQQDHAIEAMRAQLAYQPQKAAYAIMPPAPATRIHINPDDVADRIFLCQQLIRERAGLGLGG